MNVVLWIVQVILAVVYAVAGIMKVAQPKAKLLPVMAGVMFPNALTELGGMKAAVTDSELDWTLARIISRADIAAFWE
jgi:hypothetical protein